MVNRAEMEAILLDRQIEILRICGNSDTSCTYVHLLANIVALFSHCDIGDLRNWAFPDLYT